MWISQINIEIACFFPRNSFFPDFSRNVLAMMMTRRELILPMPKRMLQCHIKPCFRFRFACIRLGPFKQGRCIDRYHDGTRAQTSTSGSCLIPTPHLLQRDHSFPVERDLITRFLARIIMISGTCREIPWGQGCKKIGKRNFRRRSHNRLKSGLHSINFGRVHDLTIGTKNVVVY